MNERLLCFLLGSLLLCDVLPAWHVHLQIKARLCPRRPSLRWGWGGRLSKAWRRAGASTSVQQPLHPVFEVAQVAVTFPGVLSQLQVLEIGERLERCPFQPAEPVPRERQPPVRQSE